MLRLSAILAKLSLKEKQLVKQNKKEIKKQLTDKKDYVSITKLSQARGKKNAK